MVNLQNQGLKYDPPLLWIDDADRQAKWYQQLQARMDRQPPRGPRLRRTPWSPRPCAGGAEPVSRVREALARPQPS